MDTLRLLIVEDSAADAQLLVAEVEQAGYQVVSERVQTAAALIDAPARAAWDVVISDYAPLTDLVLPRMDGSQLAKLVKHERPEMQVLFMSGMREASARGPSSSNPTCKCSKSRFRAKRCLPGIGSCSTWPPPGCVRA